MKKSEKDVSPSYSKGYQALEPSIGHKARYFPKGH
jgi:hypothetical protein